MTALSLSKVMWRFQPAFELDFSAPSVSELQPCVSPEVLGRTMRLDLTPILPRGWQGSSVHGHASPGMVVSTCL